MRQLMWTDELIKKLWKYYSKNPNNFFSYVLKNEITDYFKKYIKKSNTILDYGAGTGALTEQLLKTGKNVACVEFDNSIVKKLNRKFKSYKNFLGAFTTDELIKSKLKFDLVILIEIIEHLSNHYLVKTFNNIIKILKRDNRIIITTPNDENLDEQMIYCPVSDYIFHKYQHVRSWNNISLSNYLKKTGFNIIKITTTDFKIKKLKKMLIKIKNNIKKYILWRNDLYKYPQLICVVEYKNGK